MDAQEARPLVFFLMVTAGAVFCCQLQTVRAADHANNSRYQMYHIKQKAQLAARYPGRADERVQYIYQDASVRRSTDAPGEIGTTRLERGSRVRELHIAVEMRNPVRLNQRDKNGKISIGRVTGNPKSLKKVDIVIHSNKPLEFAE
jgi:hypothetical protein